MLGTLDRTPPPFFRQGYSSLTKLVFFSALAVFLMVADRRLAVIGPLRSTIATALNPAQRALLIPVSWVTHSTDYARSMHDAVASEAQARKALVEQSQKALQADQLVVENKRLRALLDLRPAITVKSTAADVLYEAGDLYSRKVYIDRGSAQGIAPGSPVVTEQGLVGQVTRVYPLSAEVTLLVDKEATVPVLNARTHQRFAAYGGTGVDAPMELRFVSASSDLQEGDKLHTSGLDGVYPPGVAVGTVSDVQRGPAGGFSRIIVKPEAGMERLHHVLVLEPTRTQMPPRPEPEVAGANTRGTKGRKSAASTATPPSAASAPATAANNAPVTP